MGFGDKLFDTTDIIPASGGQANASLSSIYLNNGVGRCPVPFTDDPIEYCESKQYLDMKLRPLQKNFIIDMYSTDPKGHPLYEEGIIISGMRSGKSVTAAFIATFQAHRLLSMEDPGKQLGQIAGERLTIQCLATSLEQAGETIYSKIETMVFNKRNWWGKYIEWLQKRELQPGAGGPGSLYASFTNHIEFFEKNVAFLALHSNSGSLAGKTSACVVFDELSRFDVAEGSVQSKTQKKTAQAVYNTASRAATSLRPFSKVITITSPMYEDDYGMRLLLMAGKFKGGSQSAVVESLRARVPEKNPGLLGYHSTTFEFNPAFDPDGNPIVGGMAEDQPFFVGKRVQDPEAYRRDYLAIPPSAVSPFIEYPERMLPCVKKDMFPIAMFSDKFIEDIAESEGNYYTRRYIAKDIVIVEPNKVTKYYVCCDQGEKKDSYVVAMGHGEEITKKETDTATGKENTFTAYRVVIDLVEAWVPNRQDRVTVHFKNVEECIIKLAQSFNIVSVTYDQWQNISALQNLFANGIYTEQMGATFEMYETLKMMIYSNLIILPQNETLLRELRQLNALKGKSVDHPSDGSKDLADAVCRVAWKLFCAYVRDAYQGNFMAPNLQRFPTLRSIAQASEFMMGDQMGIPASVFGQDRQVGMSMSSGGIFTGEYVRTTVQPNLD